MKRQRVILVSFNLVISLYTSKRVPNCLSPMSPVSPPLCHNVFFVLSSF